MNFDNGNFDGSMGSDNGVFRGYLPIEDHKEVIQREYGLEQTPHIKVLQKSILKTSSPRVFGHKDECRSITH